MKKHSIYPLLGIAMFAFAFSTLNKSAVETNASADCTLKTNKIGCFDGEVSNPEALKVSVLDATKTTTGQSFSLSFSTGGQGFSDTTNTYVLAPLDSSFDSYYSEFNKLTIEERKELTAKIEAGEQATENFVATVYSITGKSTSSDVIIPKALLRGVFFRLNVESISSKAISDWTDVSSIAIPSTVQTISADSFVNVPTENFKFKVEFKNESEIPEGWDEDWAHGAEVEYGYTYTKKTAEPASSGGAPEYGDKTKVYILGWYSNDEHHLPLVIEYDVLKDGLFCETRYYEVPLQSATNYHVVGYSSFKKELNANILLNEDEEIDTSVPFKYHNILLSPEGKIDPIFGTKYVATSTNSFTHIYDLREFVDIKFKRIASFGNYIAIDTDITISNENVYSKLKPSYYSTHEPKIKSGVSYIRYRFTSLSQCYYEISYLENGALQTKQIAMTSPINQVILQKVGTKQSAFLISKSDISSSVSIDASDIKAISFINLYVTLDIFNDDDGIVARSGITTRFGNVSVLNANQKALTFNINLFLILFMIGYTAAFIGGSVGLFFYMKNKYKNDEFRRVKPMKYLKEAAISFLGSSIVLLLILSIIMRGTMLSNAIVVYNPIDAFIIVCGVLSVIVIGYFGFYIFKSVKTYKERKRILKLKLAEDVSEDGTN